MRTTFRCKCGELSTVGVLTADNVHVTVILIVVCQNCFREFTVRFDESTYTPIIEEIMDDESDDDVEDSTDDSEVSDSQATEVTVGNRTFEFTLEGDTNRKSNREIVEKVQKFLDDPETMNDFMKSHMNKVIQEWLNGILDGEDND